MRWMIWLAGYLVLINIITFIIYGVDKKRAKRREWRIPEKVLFLLVAIGGSIGAILGMLLFRHKTRKWYFRIGLPAILLVQAAVLILVWKYLQ